MSERKSDDKIIDAEAEPLPKAAPPRLRIVRALVVALAAVFVSLALAVGYHVWTRPTLAPVSVASRPAPPPPVVAPAPAADPQLAQRLADLERRHAALSGTIERLQQLPGAAADAERVAKLEADLAALADTVKAQAAQAEAVNKAAAAREADLGTRIAALDNEIARLREQRTQTLRQPIALLLAWQGMRDPALAGKAFAAPRDAMALLIAPEGEAVRAAFTALGPFAEKGTPGAAALALRYQAALAEQMRAPEAAPESDAALPWWERAWAKMTRLVTVRRIGAAAEGDDAKLQAAEAALAEGDVAAAIAALEGAALRPALAQWRAEAERRVKLETALDAFGKALSARLLAEP